MIEHSIMDRPTNGAEVPPLPAGAAGVPFQDKIEFLPDIWATICKMQIRDEILTFNCNEARAGCDEGLAPWSDSE